MVWTENRTEKKSVWTETRTDQKEWCGQRIEQNKKSGVGRA